MGKKAGSPALPWLLRRVASRKHENAKPRRKRHHCLHVHSYADLRCLTLNPVKRWFAQIEQ